MRRRIDVPALVTGLIVLGFAAMGAWILLGGSVIGPTAMWFATILIMSGIVGLIVSLTTSRR